MDKRLGTSAGAKVRRDYHLLSESHTDDSEKTLDERGHRPSPLAALPHYTALYELVEKVKKTLPRGTALLDVIVEVRQKTWAGLKDVMSK